MRITRFGGHHEVSTGEGVSTQPCQVSCPGWVGVGVANTHPQKGSGTRDIHLLVDRMTDRHLWKHYLPQTSLAGSKKFETEFYYHTRRRALSCVIWVS